ncbi:hypothetical protein JCM10212_007154 [Sporobolomyces blumeae]
MHSPFSLAPLIPPDQLGSDPISAVLLHADRILLGTDKGSILVFDLSSSPSTSTAPPAVTLVARHDRLTNKSIDQLAVIKELNALVCLSGGDLFLFSLPDLASLSSFASQTKGTCSLFALSTDIHHPSPSASSVPSSVPEIHTTLALACRRRLLVLSWVDGTWNPQVETSLPHQIRGMAFERRKLFAGFSTGEYGIVTLPPLDRVGSDSTLPQTPTLGDLFSLPLPVADPRPTKASSSLSGGSALGTFGLSGVGAGFGALSGLALGKKLEKNGVVRVPKHFKGKARQTATTAGDEADAKVDRWFEGKEWGWDDDDGDGEARGRDEGEVVVVRDHIALPVSTRGKPRSSSTERHSVSAIKYSSSVDETLVLPPYVVSLLAPDTPSAPAGRALPSQPSLVVHALESLAFVQKIPVPPEATSPTSDSPSRPPLTARLLTASSSSSSQPPILLVTSDHPNVSTSVASSAARQTVWIGTMKPWDAQVLELGAKGEWDVAIRLLRRSSALSGRNPLPRPLLRRLSTLHALHLFETRRYGLAIDAFIALDVSPAKVVALYREQISGKLCVPDSDKEGLFGGRDRQEVEREQVERSSRAAQNATDEDEGSGVSEPRTETSSPARQGLLFQPRSTDAKTVHDDEEDRVSIRSVSSRLTGKRSWLREREASSAGLTPVDESGEKAKLDKERQDKLEKKNYATSVDELIRYLTDRRQRYSQALAALEPSSRPSPSSHRTPSTPEELLALPNSPLTDLSPAQLARTAQVVDTALFRSYLATKPSMVGPLCRIENWCEVEEVEELLLQAKKYRELLDLYNGKGMHEKAVKLLRRMSDDEDDPEEKPGDTVRYLQKLGPDHIDVIFQASKWVFEQDAQAGLEIFIADYEEVESLPRHDVMAHLERIGRGVCIRYLEHIIHTLGEEGSEFHEKLIELYLDAMQSADKARDETAYAELLEFLETSTSYRPDRMLGRLPSEDMHEVRAILLGRLGRHEGALQIYVYQLEDHATAEQYCKRVYDSDESMRATIFLLLLRLYLRPRPSHPLLFAPALSLLSTHAARIDPLEAFDLLPPLVALGDLEAYLQKTLRRSTQRRREATVVKNVGKSAIERGERELVDLQERRVKITESRVCPYCHKRLGNSVIAIHNPHGEVTHYQCRELFQNSRSTTSAA